jgi:hypothetical protein
MEAPDNGEPNSALPSFTPISFTGALACPACGGTIGNPQNGDTFAVVKPASGVTPAKTLTSTTLAATSVKISFIG